MSEQLETMAVNGSPVPCAAGDRDDFTPAHYAGADDAPVYTLGPLTIGEVNAVLRKANQAAGFPPSTDEIRLQLREAALAECEPDTAARICGDLDTLADLERVTEPDEQLTAALDGARERVRVALVRLTRKSQDLRDLLNAESEWRAAYADLTIRAGIRDWRGLAVPCTKRGGFVLEVAMLAVPDRDLAAISQRVLELTRVSRSLEPGSASP
jgi:hypothetical protein